MSSFDPVPIPENIPVTPEDHVAMLLVTAKRFVDYAALFAPVAADTEERLQIAPILVRFASLRAVAVAAETGWAISKIGLDIEMDDWLKIPVLEMAFPGFLAFTPTFVGIITRWGFEEIVVPMEDGREDTRYFIRRPEAVRLPLSVAYAELAIMERAIRVLALATKGVGLVTHPKHYILTPQGTFRLEARTADRIKVDTNLLTMEIDGKEVAIKAGEYRLAVILWADAIVRGDRVPVCFTDVQKVYPDQLGGKNATYVKNAFPAEFMKFIIDYKNKGLGLT